MVMEKSFLMIDIAGLELTSEDRELLKHPKVGGVILFERNFDSMEQLIQLTHHIHALRTPPLMIAVDHEGGRVQRFRKGFTAIPSMRELGYLYDKSPQEAIQKTEALAWTMGSELRAVGIDCSFAPVLDLDYGVSEVIGNRSFHPNPEVVGLLGAALVRGLHKAHLIAVAKHFPGHGYVHADSHTAVPIDQRDLATLMKTDLLPFQHLINAGVDGIMPAHVIYEKIDPHPAGFSPFWLQQQCRQHLQFRGIIFSDDLCMAGATPMGTMQERVSISQAAGCDMLLICNNRQAVIEVL